MRYWLVMPAAGSGSRFGGDQPKQFVPLAGASVIEHALAPFLADERCQGAVVALDAADAVFAQLPVARHARLRQVSGGARRCDSVRLALDAVAGADTDWVLVHDAARPCVTRQDIDRLLAELAGDPVGGLLAVRLSDTLKRVDATGLRVADTPPREGLWRALTPQMFRLGMLRKALAAAEATSREPTDEAQAIEWLGFAPRLVAGNPGNIKITTPGDLRLASAWFGHALPAQAVNS